MTTNTLLGFLVDETAAQAVIFPASSMVEAKLLVLALHDVEILGHNLGADDDVRREMNERPGQRRTGISRGSWWAYTQMLVSTTQRRTWRSSLDGISILSTIRAVTASPVSCSAK